MLLLHSTSTTFIWQFLLLSVPYKLKSVIPMLYIYAFTLNVFIIIIIIISDQKFQLILLCLTGYAYLTNTPYACTKEREKKIAREWCA